MPMTSFWCFSINKFGTQFEGARAFLFHETLLLHQSPPVSSSRSTWTTIHPLAGSPPYGLPTRLRLRQPRPAANTAVILEAKEAAEKFQIGVRRTHMARLGASKKKKSSHTADPRQIKKELKRVTEQLDSSRSRARTKQLGITRGLGASDRNGRGAGYHRCSPTDVQPVLDAIVESASRVCGIDRLVLRLREGNAMVPRAHFGPAPITSPEISADEATTLPLDARAWRAPHS